MNEHLIREIQQLKQEVAVLKEAGNGSMLDPRVVELFEEQLELIRSLGTQIKLLTDRIEVLEERLRKDKM